MSHLKGIPVSEGRPSHEFQQLIDERAHLDRLYEAKTGANGRAEVYAHHYSALALRSKGTFSADCLAAAAHWTKVAQEAARVQASRTLPPGTRYTDFDWTAPEPEDTTGFALVK